MISEGEMMPLYIMCMRPNSVDTNLFANRDSEYKAIKGKIGMFLDNRGEERRKLMIYGERGVGKSILLRKIIKDITEERDVISIIVDGDEARSPDDLLRDICKKLAFGLDILYSTKGIKAGQIEKEIAFLDFISYAQVLKDSHITTFIERIEGNVEGGIGIFNLLTLRSKIASTKGKDRATSQEIEQNIDAKFLIKLLESVTNKVHESADIDILIYIDNLDQLENKDSIDDFVTEIIKLKKPIITASMRREVADKNIGRDFKEVQLIEPMTPDGLGKVVEKRLAIECARKDELADTPLMDIANSLKEITGNPLSLLTWLHYLIVDSELDSSRVVENLKGFTKAHYSTFDESTIKDIAQYYIKTYKESNSEFITREQIIDNTSIGGDLFGMLMDFGVIVPDNKENPFMYKISSDFMFYKLDMLGM